MKPVASVRKPLAKAVAAMAVGALALALAFLLLPFWRQHVKDRCSNLALTRARALLDQRKPAQALALIDQAERIDAADPRRFRRWLVLEIQALSTLHQVRRLTALHERFPDLIEPDEEASLLVARTLLFLNKSEPGERIIRQWESRSMHPEYWLALRADGLLLQGRRDDASQLLKAASFPGAADSGRLCRLAVLAAPNDLPAAWNYLAEACRADSRNPEVRLFRGELLEGLGKTALARVEYVAAHVAQPQDPLMRDALAEFYRRSGNLSLALVTWCDGLENSNELIWLKTLFWSQAVEPAKTDWTARQAPNGALAPVLEALLRSERNGFPAARVVQAASGSLANERQELFWLSVLGDLQAGQDAAALEKLRFSPFNHRWFNPDLAAALQRVLSFRVDQTLCPVGDPLPPSDLPPDQRHQFFLQLERFGRSNLSSNELPSDLAAFLAGDDAIAAVFLAGGWREAALRLCSRPAAASPEWLVYAFAQALRLNRGPQPALDYLADKGTSTVLSLLRAELLLSCGRLDEGLKQLRGLSQDDSDAGYRATLILALAALDQHQPAQAAQEIQSHPRLRASLEGQEILARAALSSGSLAQAEEIYAALANQSAEAKAFLARQAFARQQWPRARELTEQLLVMHPDELQLRANLAAISAAEAGHPL